MIQPQEVQHPIHQQIELYAGFIKSKEYWNKKMLGINELNGITTTFQHKEHPVFY